MNIGEDYKTFDNYSSLPDSTINYGTVESGKLYNYKYNPYWNPPDAKSTFLLTDPELGEGKVPQDPNYGDSQKGIGKNPAHPERTPPYLTGSHLHKAYGNGGSHGCVIEKGFDDEGGLGEYLRNDTQTGDAGRVLILREK